MKSEKTCNDEKNVPQGESISKLLTNQKSYNMSKMLNPYECNLFSERIADILESKEVESIEYLRRFSPLIDPVQEIFLTTWEKI